MDPLTPPDEPPLGGPPPGGPPTSEPPTSEPRWPAAAAVYPPQAPSLRERLAEARRQAAEAGRRAAEKGKSGLTQAEERVRRKLDERATAREPGPPLPPSPPAVHAPPPRPPAQPQPSPVQASPPPPVQWSTPAERQVAPPAPMLLPPVRPAVASEVVHYVPAQSPVPYERVQPRPPLIAELVPAQPRQRSRSLNGAVLAAFIVAVVFPPAGLGLAKTARRECREDGRPGAGLALVAHIIAAAGTCVIVLVALVLFSVFAYGMVQVGNGLSAIGGFLGWIGRLFG